MKGSVGVWVRLLSAKTASLKDYIYKYAFKVQTVLRKLQFKDPHFLAKQQPRSSSFGLLETETVRDDDVRNAIIRSRSSARQRNIPSGVSILTRRSCCKLDCVVEI